LTVLLFFNRSVTKRVSGRLSKSINEKKVYISVSKRFQYFSEKVSKR